MAIVSNYQAIATVTAILQRVLQSSVQLDVQGARVTTLQPRQIGSGTPETGINVFLYQVTRNSALVGNADASPFRTKSSQIKRRTALELHYVISFYGNEAELEPQRLLGSVTRTFNDFRTLVPELIEETLMDPAYRFLVGSNLAEQIQQLSIAPIDLSLDDLSKIWSVFFQSPYFLSLVYKVTAVIIDGEESLPRALPVRDRSLGGIVPFPNQPVVDQVISEAGGLEPIVATSTLVIRGKSFTSRQTQVRIGGWEMTPRDVKETQITLALSDFPSGQLRAGIQGLQVIHVIPSELAQGWAGTRQVESNAAPIVLRPTIQRVQLSDQTGQAEEDRSATLTIQVDVVVGIKQRVILVLNEWSINHPVVYQFEALPREMDTEMIVVPIQGVKPGEYLLRIQIDGAESLLTIDADPASPTFQWYSAPRIQMV